MATDLIAKLRLEDREWNNTINKAKSSVKSFETTSKKSFSGASSASDLLGKGFGKISGYVAGAVTAVEVFNKAINSNSALQDRYNSLLQAGATVTDQFFSALYSGDWTVFNQGIEKAIKQAKEYANTYREVQRMLQVTGVKYEQTDSRKTQLEAIIEDDTKPLEERKKAQSELDRILLMGIADIREAAQITEKELGRMFTDLIGETKYINTDNAQSLILNIRNKYSDLRREMDAYREIRDTKNQVINPNSFKYTGDEWYKINQEATKKYYRNYTADQRVYYDELLRLQDRMNDETFSSFQDLFDRINDLNDKAGTWEKDRTGARDAISDAISGSTNSTSSTKKNAEKIFDEGSIAYLQKNIQKLQTEFEQAGNDGLRAGLNKAIKEAETQLQMLKLRAEKQELISDNVLSGATYRNPLDDINSGKLPKLNVANNDQLTDAIELTDLLGESLYFVSDALGGLNGLLDESKSKWVQYGATLAASITKSIPLIIAATKATQAKAIAEGASSAAQTPLVGWINAIAAISAMMAAFASMPMYATGGIVGGSSFVGDNMLIRANSGEMILNKKQQANLFNLLDGGYMAKSLSSGNVEFKIKGKELVGVLTAYNNKVSKYI
jgi:hypothetical protein